MVRKKILYMGVIGCSVGVYTTVASAFDQMAVTSVKEQSSEYYTAEGGRIGTLIVHPDLSLGQVFDDNIYRTAQDQKNDRITVVEPSLNIQSDWNLHQVKVGASAELGYFDQYNSEDYNDYTSYISGRYDLDYQTYLNAGYRFQHLHEDRGDLDDVDGDMPIEYSVQTADMGFARALGVLQLYLNGVFRTISYEDSRRGLAAINNSIRDRDQTMLRARVAYNISDDFSVFVQGQRDFRRYSKSASAFRDSDGYAYNAGFSLNLSGKTQLDAYAGHISYKYDARSGFDDIDSVDYGSSLLWNLSGITSVRGSLGRQVVETTLSGSSGVFRTTANLQMEHALRENIILSGYLGAQSDKYRGNGNSADRNNVTYTSGIGVEYKFTENLGVNAQYDYLKRNFDANTNGYDDNKFMLIMRYML